MFIEKLKFTVSSISQNICWILPDWQWSILCSKEKSLFSTLSPALGNQWWVSFWSISATLLQRTFCPYRDFRSHFYFSSFWLTFFGFCFVCFTSSVVICICLNSFSKLFVFNFLTFLWYWMEFLHLHGFSLILTFSLMMFLGTSFVLLLWIFRLNRVVSFPYYLFS